MYAYNAQILQYLYRYSNLMASQVTATMCALEWKWHPSKSEAEQRRLKMSGAVGRYFLWELNNITPQFTVNPDLKSEYCTPIFSWDYLIPKSCLRYSGNKGSVLSSLQYLRSLDEGWLMEGAVVKSINKYKELKGSLFPNLPCPDPAMSSNRSS